MNSLSLKAENTSETFALRPSSEALLALPIAFRVVTTELLSANVSPALRAMIPIQDGLKCCESLGLRHRESECPTLKSMKNNVAHSAHRWLGKRYVRIDSVPLLDKHGNVMAVVEWFHDETHVKKLEAALVEKQDILETINKAMIEANHHLEDMQLDIHVKNESLESANERLRSLDKLKDEFVNIVSHELKIPLTSIRGSVDLIIEELAGDAPARTRDLLAMCKRNVMRLQRLVMDLLDLARIESGRLSMQFDHFDAASWLADATDTVRTQATAKSLKLVTDIQPHLVIHGDRERLLQVVVNLLNNAIKFTDSGQISVSIQSAENNVCIVVKDSGKGISPHDLENIFEKYSQSGGLDHRVQGFGLGLTIARGIIREHGGTVAAANDPAAGAVFTIKIPQPLQVNLNA